MSKKIMSKKNLQQFMSLTIQKLKNQWSNSSKINLPFDDKRFSYEIQLLSKIFLKQILIPQDFNSIANIFSFYFQNHKKNIASKLEENIRQSDQILQIAKNFQKLKIQKLNEIKKFDDSIKQAKDDNSVLIERFKKAFPKWKLFTWQKPSQINYDFRNKESLQFLVQYGQKQKNNKQIPFNSDMVHKFQQIYVQQEKKKQGFFSTIKPLKERCFQKLDKLLY